MDQCIKARRVPTFTRYDYLQFCPFAAGSSTPSCFPLSERPCPKIAPGLGYDRALFLLTSIDSVSTVPWPITHSHGCQSYRATVVTLLQSRSHDSQSKNPFGDRVHHAPTVNEKGNLPIG